MTSASSGTATSASPKPNADRTSVATKATPATGRSRGSSAAGRSTEWPVVSLRSVLEQELDVVEQRVQHVLVPLLPRRGPSLREEREDRVQLLLRRPAGE